MKRKDAIRTINEVAGCVARTSGEITIREHGEERKIDVEDWIKPAVLATLAWCMGLLEGEIDDDGPERHVGDIIRGTVRADKMLGEVG